MRKLAIIIVAVIATIAASCSSDKEITSVSKITVNVAMPEDFPATAKFNGDVLMSDKNSTKVYTVQAVNGVAEFKNVKFGVYNITVAQSMTAAEFAAAAPELAANVSGGIALNGNSANATFVDETSSQTPVEITLAWSVPSSLVISKIYSYGTLNLAAKTYNIDKYWEIYNNSAEVQYVDGLCLGEVYGMPVNTAESVYASDQANCYMQRVVAIPGTGTQYPVQPGKSIVIAQNAKNHIVADVITQTVDLTSADFECFVEGSTSFFPADNADVPNLEQMFASGTYTAKFGASQGAIITLFKKTKAEIDAIQTVIVPGSDSYGAQYALYCLPIPVGDIIDAVDVYYNKFPERKYKKTPTAIDASIIALDQSSTTERKVAYKDVDGRIVLQDTNNSAQDFVLIAPRTTGGADHLAPRDYTKPEINK